MKAKPLICPVCTRRMSKKRKDLLYPEQPEARLKCDKCGTWATMRALGVTLDLQTADFLKTTRAQHDGDM
jgi:hypothetical protein